MVMFIRAHINGGKLVFLEAQRVCEDWTVVEAYASKIQGQYGMQTTIQTIGLMLKRTDIIAFTSQEARDMFACAAKRLLGKHILARMRVVSQNNASKECPNLCVLLRELRRKSVSPHDYVESLEE